ncbi:hypothetical protein KYI09_01950 [Macrococcoides caseolyticum]|uniref:hypothetical protein n=1 Tax=Macrococcoides caseolyticum TaxID=69966 RepID=UPI000C32ADCA|nr:hypothetical protein [Macrococcus caseolyticus]PKE49403.1 hypothetical protein CW672_09820 [Macrococcus caseolyticus]PKE62333.1 hypothetical protein CW683_10840 [Macrococcus caseolyticus]PKF21845.1 hypothetical protein CW684_03075 [Macrococcus caseolyticus]PKF35902.1 hypothetical protein CW687_03075 [Macrococcus caseolyticus]PKF44655.1 hypothetical protein CW664_09615 [Macrococcus caseolyticus]
MNRKPFFYIMIFFLTFIFANVIRNITSGEPLENYLIYALVGLFILASIISDFIKIFMDGTTRTLTMGSMITALIYAVIIALSIKGLTMSHESFDRAIYIAYIIFSAILLVLTLYMDRVRRKSEALK